MEIIGLDENIILPKGWIERRGGRYKCRVCRHCCYEFSIAIVSPNYSFYHVGCIQKAPLYKKALKKHLKEINS